MLGKSMKKSLLVLITLALVACGQTNESDVSGGVSDAAFSAVADSYSVTHGERLNVPVKEGVLSNDKGTALSAALKDAPEKGALELNPDGSFSYVYEGDIDSVTKDGFNYLARSGANEMEAQATLTLLPPDTPGTPHNAAPSAETDSYAVAEGATLSIDAADGLLANDTDAEGDALSLNVLSQPQHGSLDVQPDGAFVYVHDHSETLSDSFAYEVSDGVGSSSAVVNLSITAVDDAPVIDKLKVAQTHVMNPAGTTWEGEKFANYHLRLVGKRAALVLVDLSAADGRMAEPVLEVLVKGQKVGEIALNTPDSLPPTEVDGPAYSESAYWANLDKAWVTPGLELRIRANEGQLSETRAVTVGAPTKFTMYTLPFYLFGLDESDILFEDVAAPDEATKTEYYAKHPLSELEMINHPAKKSSGPILS